MIAQKRKGDSRWVSLSSERLAIHSTSLSAAIEGEQIQNSEVTIRQCRPLYFRPLDESTRVQWQSSTIRWSNLWPFTRTRYVILEPYLKVSSLNSICPSRNWWSAIQAYLSPVHSGSFGRIFRNHRPRWFFKQRSFRGTVLRPSKWNPRVNYCV